jgi:hypothetical protein
MRRHARGWLEASGLRDPNGKTTARARSRPQARNGRLTVRTLRQMGRHDRDHERAAGHEAKAARSRIPAVRTVRQHRAASLRSRWPERAPRPAAARPAPAAPRAGSTGTRPAPARPAPASRPAPRPAPTGRLAPPRPGRTTR